jgi:hypothetical protein
MARMWRFPNSPAPATATRSFFMDAPMMFCQLHTGFRLL